MRRLRLSSLFLLQVFVLPGCIVIPIGDLLKPPVLQEQVLVEGEGLFTKEKIAIVDISGLIIAKERTGLFLPQESAVSEIKSRLTRIRRDPRLPGFSNPGASP